MDIAWTSGRAHTIAETVEGYDVAPDQLEQWDKHLTREQRARFEDVGEDLMHEDLRIYQDSDRGVSPRSHGLPRSA